VLQASLLEIYDSGTNPELDVAVICLECSETLTLTSTVDAVTESDVELPLDDDYYD